jgi:hypothetical protein
MKTLLTLVAAITSLSAYTLVGVHAAHCVNCDSYMAGADLHNKCITGGVTICE